MPESPPDARAYIRITYCTQCNWLLRSSWMATELLNTFGTEIAEVTLVPSTGGTFFIEVNGQLAWERKRDSGFPDAVGLKRAVRDIAFPEWNLGHGEATAVTSPQQPTHSPQQAAPPSQQAER